MQHNYETKNLRNQPEKAAKLLPTLQLDAPASSGL